jgi:hypothetical protein
MKTKLSRKIETNDPKQFVEVSFSYNKPPDYVNDRLPKSPYYQLVVLPVKIEGSFEVRTAFSGRKMIIEGAPKRFSQKALQTEFDNYKDSPQVNQMTETVLQENNLSLKN